MQRYDFFPNHQNFSKKNFSFQQKYFLVLICVNSKTFYTLLYITREEGGYSDRNGRKPQPVEHNNKNKEKSKKEHGEGKKKQGRRQKRHIKVWLYAVFCIILRPNLNKYTNNES